MCFASSQPPEKYLLSEVNINDYGKKCVVIDLDETLVHSSFKVIIHVFRKWSKLLFKFLSGKGSHMLFILRCCNFSYRLTVAYLHQAYMCMHSVFSVMLSDSLDNAHFIC